MCTRVRGYTHTGSPMEHNVRMAKTMDAKDNDGCAVNARARIAVVQTNANRANDARTNIDVCVRKYAGCYSRGDGSDLKHGSKGWTRTYVCEWAGLKWRRGWFG